MESTIRSGESIIQGVEIVGNPATGIRRLKARTPDALKVLRVRRVPGVGGQEIAPFSRQGGCDLGRSGIRVSKRIEPRPGRLARVWSPRLGRIRLLLEVAGRR